MLNNFAIGRKTENVVMVGDIVEIPGGFVGTVEHEYFNPAADEYWYTILSAFTEQTNCRYLPSQPANNLRVIQRVR